MTTLVEYPLKGDRSILIEISDEDKASGLTRSAREGKVIEKAIEEFGKVMESVNYAAKTVLDSLSDLDAQHVAVEFGVKLSGGLDVIIAKASGEANFKVTVTRDK